MVQIDDYGAYYSGLIEKAEGVLLEEFKTDAQGNVYYFNEAAIYEAFSCMTPEEDLKIKELQANIHRLWGEDREEFRGAVLSCVKEFLLLSRKYMKAQQEFFMASITAVDEELERRLQAKVAEDRLRRQEARGF